MFNLTSKQLFKGAYSFGILGIYSEVNMQQEAAMEVYSPNVLWHGGATVEGKTDPVFSLDVGPGNILCTAGIDENLPPKGCVRLWKLPVGDDIKVVMSDDDKFKDNFIIGLPDHQHAVNICRFSPCGKMLATASTRQIVVYTLQDANGWGTLSHESDSIRKLGRTYLRPSLDEIRDLAWSPDCTSLVAGSVDNKAEILRISSRDSIILHGHNSYVQGVAWDPLNQYVCTQSADRSMKSHALKSKPGNAVKLANKGNCVAKMHNGYDLPEGVEPPVLTAADFGMAEDVPEDQSGNETQKSKIDKKNLYADSTVPSFFRRPTYSPDGLLLFSPTGVHRSAFSTQPDYVPLTEKNTTVSKNEITYSGSSSSGSTGNSFCTHVYSREHLNSPILSLLGLEDPSVAVRCSPVLYNIVKSTSETDSSIVTTSVFRGDYRTVFAVITITAVYIYDTQHPYPLARVGGLHHACINDIAWSYDGNMLIICSSDGYVSFIKFANGALGEKISDDKVPATVKNMHRCLYNYTPPPIVIPTKKPKVGDSVATPKPNLVTKTENATDTNAVSATKKRITPMAVTTESAEKVDGIAAAAVDVEGSQASAGAAVKKRRITPMLVTNALPIQSSSSSAPTDDKVV